MHKKNSSNDVALHKSLLGDAGVHCTDTTTTKKTEKSEDECASRAYTSLRNLPEFSEI